MKTRTLKKLNNQGSTFVLALIIITLVTTLALAIMAASISNMAMKGVDRNSKNTFYTAESVLDEIRAGVGLNTMNSLGKAYESVLTNIVRTNSSGYSYIVDNDSANEEFKCAFIDYVVSDITGGLLEFQGSETEIMSNDLQAREQVKTYLEGFIKGYEDDMASITSIGNIQAYKNSDTGLTYVVIIEDVSVSYKEQKSGETYFASVTADLEIEFPNMTVDFSNSNRLNDYINYGFIADRNLTVSGCQANINASVYAGNKISVTASSSRGGELMSSSLVSGENINIVCGGDNGGESGSIVVSGNADFRSKLSFSATNIWCTNLVTGKLLQGGSDKTVGADITVDSLCNTYVKDDLTSEGANSTIDISGAYYGYSYDGYDDSLGHVASSAIIINGKNTNLTLGISKMIVGGHAYVDLTDADDYMTGESLSFKGNQEIYLIPSKYLGDNYSDPVPNPMPEETWDALCNAAATYEDISICDVDGFFAYENGYLNATCPYTARKAGNGLVYVYLNFKDKDSAAKYVRDVANGTNGADASLTAKLDKYTNTLFEGTGSVKITSDNSQIYTKGALLVTSNGSYASAVTGTTSSLVDNMSYANSGATISNDEFVLTSMDLKNRYAILTHLLAEIPWTDDENGGRKYIVNDIDSALWQKKDYLLGGSEMTSTDMFSQIIDESWLSANPYNSTGAYIQYGDAGMNYIKIAIDGSYIVPSDCNGGIIVATGNVKLDHDFTGLIIAGQDIEVIGNASIKTNAVMVEYLITNEPGFKVDGVSADIPFREYFYAYKRTATEDDSREEVKVETVDYKDIVNFNNWRKYED